MRSAGARRLTLISPGARVPGGHKCGALRGEPLLLRCRLLLPCASCSPLTGVAVYVEDGRIGYIGDGPPAGAKRGAVVDCPRYAVAMPCLYNAHTHAAMTLLRGFHDDSELHEWLERMWHVEKRVTPDVAYHASLLAVVEMASTGTCGFMDMYFWPHETLRAARELGLRARLGPVIMGDVDPYKAVEEAVRFARSLQGDPLAGGVVNVHSIYAAPLEAVREGYRAAEELGVPFHIHVSETRREVYEAKKRFGKFPVELLESLGALGPRAVLVHAGWIASWELEAVRRAGASLVHCPTSNMKLATAGSFPLYEAMESGVNVALGTDGPASNNSLDMIREAKTGLLLQRHSYWDTRVKARHLLEAATRGGARAMGVRGAGAIEPGAPADILVLDLSRPWSLPLRADNLASALLYSAAGGDTLYTIVDGRPVYTPENRERLWSLAERSAEQLNRFLERIGEGRDPEPPCSPPQACNR